MNMYARTLRLPLEPEAAAKVLAHGEVVDADGATAAGQFFLHQVSFGIQPHAMESGGAKIDKVDKEMEHGKTVYEADAMINGKEYEIVVAEDGTLLCKKLEGQDEEGEHEDKDDEKDDDDKNEKK